ncbi:M23 family metallopeptidase [Candidatus Parcubacteria bacterium]|nr:M23 family metallopeptidase [Candidatus Parcubacteria bacterium]
MAEFQKEVSDLESQLKIEIDPNSFPAPESGVLSWPLDNIRITQFFGNTLFASQNAQVYNGNGHNGVDFGVSSGTKVKAVLGGVVKGTGNTDTIPPKCYSYGKWVLIEHNNGLSTLYAHLSLIKVEPGQFVNEGDIIGYSGNTGYSTGPHLHFGVYATAGVQIQQFTNSINCKDKFIPIASLNAYLNPMDYLPKL